MPAKNTSRVSAKQRTKIAAGRVEGKTASAIASETGLSESTVRKQASDPRTMTLVQRLAKRDEERLDRAWTKSLKTIEAHLGASDPAVARDARRDLLRFMTAGDPPLARLEVKPMEDTNSYTLEELLTSYRDLRDRSDA